MQDRGGGDDGVFIVLEGIDGAGTTTQCARYASHLRAARRLVHVTREPSTGPVGSLIRLILSRRVELPGAQQADIMALLYAADRLDHIGAEVEPFLRDGYVVISDRYDLSSLIYQSITRAGGDVAGSVEWIRTLNRSAPRPDVTVVLDVSPEVAAQRRKARGGAAELFDDAEIQARLSEAYRSAEAFVPGERVIHVSGEGDEDSVARAVAEALSPIISPS